MKDWLCQIITNTSSRALRNRISLYNQDLFKTLHALPRPDYLLYDADGSYDDNVICLPPKMCYVFQKVQRDWSTRCDVCGTIGHPPGDISVCVECGWICSQCLAKPGRAALHKFEDGCGGQFFTCNQVYFIGEDLDGFDDDEDDFDDYEDDEDDDDDNNYRGGGGRWGI